MIYLFFFIYLCFNLSYSQQYYDETLCSSYTNKPGTRYTCSSSQNSCETYIVYRSNNHFPTIFSISNLFKIDQNRLLSINNVSNLSQILETGYEVLVPITCSCIGIFSQANITYSVPENETLSDISCGIFQGLVKSITLAEENSAPGNNVRAKSLLHVPLKCACPDDISINAGVKYLITYPFIKGDDPKKLSEKFNASVEEILKVNSLEPTPTVYATTTVLVPLKDKPFINFNILDSNPPTPQFFPTELVEKTSKLSQVKKLYIIGSIVGFSLIVALLVACGLYIKALKKYKAEKINSLTHRISSINSCSTPNSCLSPEIRIGIKYSLKNYRIEELKQATKNFGEENKIDNSVYKGCVNNGEVMMIKHIMFEGTRQVIEVHSKINHVNIVKLHGICYGDDDFSCSYLVFEYPFNGSLRDCLSSSSSSLHWHRRTQIAFDIATGLHYLHYSVSTPAYTQLSLNCKNIFLTSTWRAKITVFGTTAPCNFSEKVDICAFGMLLWELLSGKDSFDRDAITFLGGGISEGGCFDELRNFVDPCLKDDYPIAEALCLAVLAGSCVEDDPLHRPSVDDVLKVLARMI